MRNLRNYFAAYASNYPENKIQTLLLLGEAGLGKTYLMSCLAKELQKKQEDILFISSAQLFSVFHRNRLGECSLIQPIFDAAVLFIDDLGSEPMTQNVTKESLFALIDGRLRAGLPTVIAANMDISQLKQRYQERVASRMLASDTGAVFRLAGEDIRLRSC